MGLYYRIILEFYYSWYLFDIEPVKNLEAKDS